MKKSGQELNVLNKWKDKGSKSAPNGISECCGNCLYFPNLRGNVRNCQNWEKGGKCPRYKYKGHFTPSEAR